MKRITAGTCEAPTTLSMQWDFAYDGYGTRTTQLLTQYDENGLPLTPMLTVYFMGGLYEETDGESTKYYAIAGMTAASSLANVALKP